MLGAGFEPAWGFPPGILSPLRLPISPPERDGGILHRATGAQLAFAGMIRPLAPAALLLALALGHAGAQLPLITVPRGALRIDLDGSFYPNDQVWDNGARRPLGAMLDGSSNALVTGLENSLAQVLGQPVSGLSLGRISAIAAREHGVGNVGLALGLTRRISVFGTVPWVFVRSRVSLTVDASTARVGLNPGPAQYDEFFRQFDAALASLALRVQYGDFAGDPTTLALAQQTLASASALRAGSFTLLADPVRASPVLPTSTDAYGGLLLTQVASLQSTLSNQLGVPGFTLAPRLPATPLTSDQFTALLGSPGGFALTSSNILPQVVLGDLEAGVAVQVAQHGTAGVASWSAAWMRFAARFPTGSAADPSVLLSQGSGDQHPALQVDGILELGRRRVGIRAEAAYQHQLPRSSFQRIGAPDQALVPASYLAAVRSQPGDSFAVTVRPFIGFAPHLAVAALAQYWWKGMNRTGYVTNQPAIAGTDPSQLDVGSAANAVVIGIGLSYVYTGAGRDGSVGLPVEAGWSIERTVASGRGIFPYALTSRVSLHIYRPLIKH